MNLRATHPKPLKDILGPSDLVKSLWGFLDEIIY